MPKGECSFHCQAGRVLIHCMHIDCWSWRIVGKSRWYTVVARGVQILIFISISTNGSQFFVSLRPW